MINTVVSFFEIYEKYVRTFLILVIKIFYAVYYLSYIHVCISVWYKTSLSVVNHFAYIVIHYL